MRTFALQDDVDPGLGIDTGEVGRDAQVEDHSADALKIVELKYFSGLTEAEIAELLEVSDRTVRRHWVYARAWLLRELGGGGTAGDA